MWGRSADEARLPELVNEAHCLLGRQGGGRARLLVVQKELTAEALAAWLADPSAS